MFSFQTSSLLLCSNFSCFSVERDVSSGKHLKGNFKRDVAFIFGSLCIYVFTLLDSFIFPTKIKMSEGARQTRVGKIKFHHDVRPWMFSQPRTALRSVAAAMTTGVLGYGGDCTKASTKISTAKCALEKALGGNLSTYTTSMLFSFYFEEFKPAFCPYRGKCPKRLT